MALSNRDAYKFYMEGAKGNEGYRVFPMDVSELTHELENIYTYRHRSNGFVSSEDLGFAIGKVRET